MIDKVLREFIKENVEKELAQASVKTRTRVRKIAKLSESLQAELGRIDDPHVLTQDDMALINELRHDVTAAFDRIKMVGMPWKVQLRSTRERLGNVYANGVDDAFEEALARWGNTHNPNDIEVHPEMLKR